MQHGAAEDHLNSLEPISGRIFAAPFLTGSTAYTASFESGVNALLLCSYDDQAAGLALEKLHASNKQNWRHRSFGRLAISQTHADLFFEGYFPFSIGDQSRRGSLARRRSERRREF